MRSSKPLTITLPTEMARSVKQRVASGAYSSESEVIREGLRALDLQESALEHWLETEIVARYDAWRANPEDALSGSQVHAALERRRKRRRRQGGVT
jgi:antitoxin ParD1/3/4